MYKSLTPTGDSTSSNDEVAGNVYIFWAKYYTIDTKICCSKIPCCAEVSLISRAVVCDGGYLIRLSRSTATLQLLLYYISDL